MDIEKIRDLLPDPLSLDLLAEWVDLYCPNDPDPEIQKDLRDWAHNVRFLKSYFQEKCIWTGSYDMWEGSCGIAWLFNDMGPVENGCNYCPKCGKRIVCKESEEQI